VSVSSRMMRIGYRYSGFPLISSYIIFEEDLK
jgi:hypothetical protein